MTETSSPQGTPAPDRESEFHKSIIDNLYDGVYYVDLNRRITYWNHRAGRSSGLRGSRSATGAGR